MPRRFGRPGLLGAMARTAVVAGTATAVSGRVQRSQAERAAQQQASADAERQALVDQAAARAAAQQQAWQQSQPAQQPAAAPVDRVGQLTALAELKAQGLLTDEEFAAEKARVLRG
ncbi:SHOCT domain-containing protein [Streptomyces sp. NBC_01264]|uniref:SHOCT domain-containing protein n=1 Tax=Streptomyces sp. NBC_01264 TaxID=2903804 RepID=UPI002259F56B|nr:SHOCT domain-containing protein [Streptomyces sp. NBC_01264]MCX4777560.1 SHOCT domain-containing protein [Streptomyces sp. NBC_01264]